MRDDSPDFVLADLALGALEAVPRWQRRRSDAEPTGATPASDGYAILRALGEGPSLPLHMVVFLRTGVAEEGRGQRFGVVDYVVKPLVPRVLKEHSERLYEALEPRPAEATPAPPSPPAPVPQRPAPANAETRVATASTPWSEQERRSASSQALPAIDALPQGLRTVLLADPDAGARGAVADLLTPHGFTVYEAADGLEALRLALARRPWMILTEVNLPGIDGFEFCRRVRSHSLLRYTPLIFVSAWDDFTERELGLRLGADEYFSKQTPARELVIRLQLILKRYLDVGRRTRRGAGMAGTIELIGAIGVLQMCHLGRLTGLCSARSGSATAQFRFDTGEVVSARCGRAEGAQAAYQFLSWERGDFEFTPGPAGGEPPLKESFDYLLLEGCRRLDDAGREGSSVEGAS